MLFYSGKAIFVQALTRAEEVLAPSFAGGQKPSTFAGFNANYNPLSRLLFSVSTVFSGGRAAVDLTNCANRKQEYTAHTPTQCDQAKNQPDQGAPGTKTDGAEKKDVVDNDVVDGVTICLRDRPKTTDYETGRFWRWLNKLTDTDYPTEWNAVSPSNPSSISDQTPSQSKMFFFTTDTTFGFKANWQGTDIFPNKLDAGFNRKEYVYVPFILRELGDGNGRDGCPNGSKYSLKIPSFLSYVNVGDVKHFSEPSSAIDIMLQRLNGLRVGYNQVFATGKAAENLAKDPDMQRNIRLIFFEGQINDAEQQTTATNNALKR